MISSVRRRWKERAQQLKRELYALMLAYKDPRVPWYARLFLLCLLGYAFSPIDLIPDFVPVLGYLDDLILLPLGILLVIKLIPPIVLQESRAQADRQLQSGRPTNWMGAIVIVGIWLLSARFFGWLIIRWIWQ
ncbi:MAG TPA: YkvA family protein [Ktedonobacteraceae bacterium]|nr:YkvA family protein [Ktedonobacteraceae bacterium]